MLGGHRCTVLSAHAPYTSHMVPRRTYKATRDMFGRRTEASSPEPVASSPGAGSEQRAAERRQRPVPLWVVPWSIPLFIVLMVVVLSVASPLIAVALALVVVTAIGVALARVTKGKDTEELRRIDPLFRRFDDYRRNYLGLDRDRPPE